MTGHPVLWQLVTSFTGTYGFCLIFHVRKKWRIPVSFLGMLGWGIYLFGMSLWNDLFVSTLIASAFCAVCAELGARIFRVPATVIFISSVISLIPGRTLYYGMSNAVRGDSASAVMYFQMTALYALAIALGMSLVWAFWYMLRKVLEQRR